MLKRILTSLSHLLYLKCHSELLSLKTKGELLRSIAAAIDCTEGELQQHLNEPLRGCLFWL